MGIDSAIRRTVSSRTRRFSHSARIIGGIVVFNAMLIVILWAFVLGALRAERAYVFDAAIQRNDSLVIALEHYVIRIIESGDVVIRHLLRERERRGDNLDLSDFVQKYTVDYPALTGIVLADERGDAVASTYPGMPAHLSSVAEQEHFKAHIDRDTGKALVGKPVVGSNPGLSVVPISRRVNREDGSFGGVAMALIAPARFTDVLQNAQMLPRDMASLVGLDGITRARLVGTDASSGQDIRGSPLLEHIDRVPVGHAIDRVPVGHAVATGRLDGVSRLYSYRTLKDYGLLAIVGRAEADVMAEFNARQIRYYWSAGLASALIAGFAMLLIYVMSSQRRAAANLVRNSARFMAAFDQAAVGITHWDRSGRHLEVNQRFCDMLGYSRKELLAKGFADITHPDDLPASVAFRGELLNNCAAPAFREWEKRYLRKDGSAVWCGVTLSTVHDHAGKIEYVLGVVHDISNRVQAEEALRTRSARLQLLSRQLMDAQEQERRRLGRELHDRIGANLSASVLSLEVLRGMTTDASPGSGPRIDDCVKMLRETIAQVRDVLADLRPPALDDLGLYAALGYYARTTAMRANVDIRIDGREPVPRLPAAVQISLFRIAQEALSNALRHAECSLVTVSLTQDSSGVTLAIIDNGKGYDPIATKTGLSSLGMLTMRERAEALGGTLVAEAAAGGGTRVVVVVPPPAAKIQ